MLYRAYYNRSADFPLVWSVDDGDQNNEVIVRNIHGCHSFNSNFDPSGDNLNSPKAYFTIYANGYVIDENKELWFIG